MRVRKASSDDVKLYDLTQVKLKTAGNPKILNLIKRSMWLTKYYRYVLMCL